MRVIVRVRSVSWLLGALAASAMGCATLHRPPEPPPAVRPPTVIIAPAPPMPEYSFALGPDGKTACLDATGLAAYEEEQRLLRERLRYLRDLLVLLGATE